MTRQMLTGIATVATTLLFLADQAHRLAV